MSIDEDPGVLTSAKLFFRGPVWATFGGVSFLVTVVGAFSDDFWLWLSIGLALLVVASFLTFDRERQAAAERAASLTGRIDDLHREGIALVDGLSRPLEPEKSGENAWKINMSAPGEWWDQAEAFDQKIRELFIETYPALLSDYSRGFNEYRREARKQEEARAPDPEKDNRSNAVKLQEFTRHMHLKPARFVEACLEGLSVARFRLG
jgi:hypothetical protein